MDSSKDFARSKRKATHRHKPGRGGAVSGTRRSAAKAELGTNEERYVWLARYERLSTGGVLALT